MASLSDAYAAYAASLARSVGSLTRDERRQALFSHVVATAGPPQEQPGKQFIQALAEHQTSTPEIAARVGAAFGRLAEDEHHESP